MIIELAQPKDREQIRMYDRHISDERLCRCIADQLVYAIKDNEQIVGVLRYSLFWQTIPFADLLYIDERYRNKGYGSKLMAAWEEDMRKKQYAYAMLSTQADECARFFYERLGYRRVGGFLPPEQAAVELMLLKKL